MPFLSCNSVLKSPSYVSVFGGLFIVVVISGKTDLWITANLLFHPEPPPARPDELRHSEIKDQDLMHTVRHVSEHLYEMHILHT